MPKNLISCSDGPLPIWCTQTFIPPGLLGWSLMGQFWGLPSEDDSNRIFTWKVGLFNDDRGQQGQQTWAKNLKTKEEFTEWPYTEKVPGSNTLLLEWPLLRPFIWFSPWEPQRANGLCDIIVMSCQWSIFLKQFSGPEQPIMWEIGCFSEMALFPQLAFSPALPVLCLLMALWGPSMGGPSWEVPPAVAPWSSGVSRGVGTSSSFPKGIVSLSAFPNIGPSENGVLNSQYCCHSCGI